MLNSCVTVTSNTNPGPLKLLLAGHFSSYTVFVELVFFTTADAGKNKHNHNVFTASSKYFSVMQITFFPLRIL